MRRNNDSGTFESDFLRYMHEQKHIMLLYEEAEDYSYVASTFIADGLKSNESCLMATDEYRVDNLLQDLSALGVDTEKCIELGQLTLIDVNKHYASGGGFDPQKTISQWQDLIDSSISKGFRGVRVVGELTFALAGKVESEKLIHYENLINTELFPFYQFMSLCVYNRKAYPGEILKAAIQSHPMLVYGRDLYKNNIYYVPPEIYFSHGKENSEIESWLSNMKTSNELVQNIVKSEERYSTIFNSSHDAFFIHELGKNMEPFIEVNDRACDIVGCSREKLLSKIPEEITTTSEKRIDEIKEALFQGEAVLFETELITDDEKRIPVDVSCNPLTIDGHKYVYSAVRDITAQRKAEVKYSTAVRATNDGIWEYNLKTGEFSYSDRWAEMLGYRQGDIPEFGCFCESNIHPEDRKRFKETFYSYLEGKLDNYEMEFRLRTRDGSYKWIYTRGRIVERDQEGSPVRMLGAHTDISERVRMEQLIMQSEKMLSVGGLAAGMAHEINNPLAAILGHAQNMQKRIFSDLTRNVNAAEECGLTLPQIREYMNKREIPRMLEGIHESGTRAAKIVANMLNFSRGSDVRMIEQDMAELLDRTLELAANDYNLEKYFGFRDIEIIREYEPDLPEIKCDGNGIQQVFLNLLRNSAEAMTEGNADTPSRLICRVRRIHDYVEVEIADNGPGMDDATLARIFDPFYTTKEVGRGTGLGLSIAYFIITEQHHGRFEARSAPGEGTRLIMGFPLPGTTSRHCQK